MGKSQYTKYWVLILVGFNAVILFKPINLTMMKIRGSMNRTIPQN